MSAAPSVLGLFGFAAAAMGGDQADRLAQRS